jgi:formate dehydrogenase subunit gamma
MTLFGLGNLMNLPAENISGSSLPELVKDIVARLRARPGPLLLVLHEVQAKLGHVPAAAVPLIAEGLNMSRAEVHGVASFYHYFRKAPAGRHTISICCAESCQAMGGEALAAYAQRRLDLRFGETTSDERFTLQAVYCLGNCACSPAIMIDDDLYGRVSPQGLDDLLAERTRGDEDTPQAVTGQAPQSDPTRARR